MFLFLVVLLHLDRAGTHSMVRSKSISHLKNSFTSVTGAKLLLSKKAIYESNLCKKNLFACPGNR